MTTPTDYSGLQSLESPAIEEYYLNAVAAQIVTAFLEHQSAVVVETDPQRPPFERLEAVIKRVKVALKDPTP